MKHSSKLRSRIALFALTPGIVCSLLIGIYLAYALIRDIALYEQDMGNAYSEQIASQAFAALQAGDITTLENTARLALEYPLLQSITFYDSQQNVMAHAGPTHKLPESMKPDALIFLPDKVQIESDKNRQLIIPIVKTRLTGTFTAGRAEENSTAKLPIGWVQLEFSRSFLMLHKYRTILIDTVVVFFILGCTFWIVMPFSDRLAGALYALTKSAKAISNGEKDFQLPDSDITEIQMLSGALESMQTSMATQQSNLQHSIDQATRDLRETLETIEIQNIEMDLARREAVQVSKIKSEFLANTSHEIRTPLNSIIGFSKLLLKTPMSSQQEDYLQNIRKSSENLLTLINDVLDLSKIEAGKLVLDYVSFEISETLEDVLQILAPGAHDKGLELLQIVYSDVPRQLLGDPLRLKQVLTNLVSNAIKFSEKGNIVVRISNENTNDQQCLLKIEVTDPGKGLPNNNPMIFNTFTQLDSSSTRKHGGTGLGLAISRKIVEQMGGDIGYHSEPGNTTFWCTVRFDIASNTRTQKNNTLLKDRHILVYDQQHLCRLTISHLLTAWGAQPVLTDNLNQIAPALDRYAGSEHPLDAVLLGLSVGYNQQEIAELVEVAANIDKRYNCPVMLCIPTSAMQELTSKCIETIKIVPKPITENRLSEALHDCLNLALPDKGTKTLATTPRKSFPSTTVLAVDDNASNLKLISSMLHEIGVNVIEACNGEEALEIVKRNYEISLIFMDIQMPVMDGVESTRRIRQLESNGRKHIPVIALTAHALAEQRHNMLTSGLDDYLSKPASEQQLLQMLEKWLQSPKTPSLYSTASISAPYNGSSNSCIDRASALKACGNKPDLAAEMLGILLARLGEERLNINAALSNGDMTLAETLIHKLHGATCYCGVTELKNCCSAMETLIKKNMTEHLPDVVIRFNEAADALAIWSQRNTPADFFKE